MPEKQSIKDWAEEERPRERLARIGASNLTNAELLAILIGSGTASQSAVKLMQSVLERCHNNLNTLGKMSINELMTFKGIGPAKAITILAACELGKRRQRTAAEDLPRLNSSQAIYEHMHPLMQDLDVEEAWVVLMNQNFKLIKTVRISHGGISETAVDVRLIMKEAVLCNATIMVLCHNHPSNNTHPSKTDDKLTDRVRKAADVMRIYFMDHIIITDGAYYSYRDEGRL